MKALWEVNDYDRLISLALGHYGPRIAAMVRGVLRGRQDQAEEAYARFCEQCWKSIKFFKWESRISTWMYTIARRCALETIRDPFIQRSTEFDAQQHGEAARLSFNTGMGLKTALDELTAAMSLLELDEEERWLIALRGEELEWNEIALLFATAANKIQNPKEHKQSVANLRKKNERLLARLRIYAQNNHLHLQGDLYQKLGLDDMQSQ